MRKSPFYLGVGLLFILWAVSIFPISARAAETGGAIPSKVGIVRLGKVFDQYDKTKVSEAQLEELSKTKQAEREKLVAEIKTMRDELPLLNDSGRLERQKAIEGKLGVLASFDRDVKEMLSKKREDSLKMIFDEIEVAVSKFAKENGFQLILSDRAVLYGVDSLDVTDSILTQLNGRPPKDRSGPH